MIDEPKLAQLRERIDAIDEQLVTLLNERARLSLQAGIAKGGRNIQRPEREAQVLMHVAAVSKGPLAGEGLRAIFEVIIKVCRTIQLNK
jgi:chorismate mutase / prephenate dehydratase